MASKKYRVINEKYGTVGSEATFSEIKKAAKENSADTDLSQDTRGDRDVVVDSHNVIVAETAPEGDQALTGGVTNRDRDKSQDSE